jgi:hypothetical protein
MNQKRCINKVNSDLHGYIKLTMALNFDEILRKMSEIWRKNKILQNSRINGRKEVNFSAH